MHRIAGGVLVLLVSLAATPDGDGQDRPATPAEQYRSLLREQERLPGELAKAETAERREQLRERQRSLPLRFLDLAERHPNDPVAVEARARVVALAHGSVFPAVGEDAPGDKALALLARDHVKSDKLGRACQHVAFGFHASREAFLRAVAERNPHREVQGPTCLSLVQLLSDRTDRLDALKDQETPDLAGLTHELLATADGCPHAP